MMKLIMTVFRITCLSCMFCKTNSIEGNTVYDFLAACVNGYVFCRSTNRCFRIDYHSTTWDKALEICQDDGGYLATFAEDIPDLAWIDKQLNLGGMWVKHCPREAQIFVRNRILCWYRFIYGHIIYMLFYIYYRM